MDRITDPTAAMNLFGAGKHGFTDGDPFGGIDPTFLNALWFNGSQEEPLSVIEGFGLVADSGDLAQLRKAVARAASANILSVTGNVALTADNAGLILATAAGAARIITLPAAAAAGGRPLRYLISKIEASANTVTITPAGAETINGVAGSLVLPASAVSGAQLIGDGVSGWWLASAFGLGEIRSLTTVGTTSQVVPIWARRMRAEAWGAGGGGGGCTSGAARGGGGGEYRLGEFPVTPGASISCTVGAGGAGGTNSPTGGASGAATSIGALMTAMGGGGGAGAGGGVATAGGAGGTGGSGGQYAVNGAGSELSYLVNASYSNSPGGGCFGGGYGAFVIAANGNDGWATSIGGSGGANGAALGGLGGSGRIILEFFP